MAWVFWQPAPPSTAQPKRDIQVGRHELQRYVLVPAKPLMGCVRYGAQSLVPRRPGTKVVQSLLAPRTTSTSRISGSTWKVACLHYAGTSESPLPATRRPPLQPSHL